eukprot:gene16989-biopygen9362
MGEGRPPRRAAARPPLPVHSANGRVAIHVQPCRALAWLRGRVPKVSGIVKTLPISVGSGSSFLTSSVGPRRRFLCDLLLHSVLTIDGGGRGDAGGDAVPRRRRQPLPAQDAEHEAPAPPRPVPRGARGGGARRAPAAPPPRGRRFKANSVTQFWYSWEIAGGQLDHRLSISGMSISDSADPDPVHSS